MTTLTLSYRAINKKIKSASLPKINWKAVYLLGILFSLSMLVFYIFLVNELTGGAYLIKNYNKEISILLQENKILENNFAQTSFLGGIQSKTRELSFEKTTQVKYVKILDVSLAQTTQGNIK